MSDLIVSRTKPITLGPQEPENSIPVYIANSEDAVINVKQAQPETEVALSLLGIPRSETTLGVFSDVTTYGIDTEIWSQFPEVWTADENGNGYGIRFLEYMSAAKIEAPPGKFAFLNTKRAFPYLPGRVSSSTFGLRCAFENRATTTQAEIDTIESRYNTLAKKPIRKWGQYSDKNGYYFEIKGVGSGDDLKVVRRTNGIEIDYIIQNYPSIDLTGNVPENSILTANNDTLVVRAPSGISADSLDYTHAVINDMSMEVDSEALNAVKVYDPQEDRFKYVDQENALVYEYRTPRSWFNSDQLNGNLENVVKYSDVITIDGVTHYPGEVSDITDTSVRKIEFDKVTMYKTEYSWYGAIGCIFLTYVPVFESTARWVKVHYLRGSNQLSFPTLGNPYLPMRFYIENPAGNNVVEGLEKYGASYYIDGADKGSVRVFSLLNDSSPAIRTGDVTLQTVIANEDLSISTWGIFNDYQYPYIEIKNQYNFLLNRSETYLIGSYIQGSIAAIKDGATYEKDIPPGSVYVLYVKRDYDKIILVLNRPIFDEIDSDNVSQVIPSPVNFKFTTPRGRTISSIQMKKTLGPANVVSKASVFPVRLNIGNIGDNTVSVKLVKNARRPITTFPSRKRNSGFGAVYDPNGDTVVIESDVREIPISFVITDQKFEYVNNSDTVCTIYIRDVPGVFRQLNRTGDIIEGTFTRYEPGDEMVLVSHNSPTHIALPIGKTSLGYDVGVQESGYVCSPGIFTDTPYYPGFDPGEDYSNTPDVFSAVFYNISDEVCALYNTGQQLTTLLTSQLNSDDFDLTPYFGFNKEFLAGSGLSVNYKFDDTLLAIANTFNATNINAESNIICNLTWEEQ